MTLRVLLTHPGASLYGSDRMALETVRGLVAAGAEVDVLLGADGPLAEQARAVGAGVRTVDMPVLRRSALTPRGLLRLGVSMLAGALRATSELRADRPDVLLVSTVTTPAWFLAARLARVPVVGHVHEAEQHTAAPVRAVLNAPLLLATRVIANSTFTLDVLAGTHPRLRSRSSVVLNGLEAPGPHAPRPEPPPGAAHRILYVGRLSERKGVLVAVEAVELLLARGRSVHLDLVGDVFGEHRDFDVRLRSRTRDLVEAGHVTFHGFDPDVRTRLDHCDVLVVPSVLSESFGNAAVEGVIAARPVVASRVGALPEALAGYRTARLVPPGDAAALADALVNTLDTLTDDPVGMREACEADAREAVGRHDPARYAEGVLEVLSAAAGVAQPRRRAYST